MNDKNHLPPELAAQILERDGEHMFDARARQSIPVIPLEQTRSIARSQPPRVALCQCIRCERYVAKDRAQDGSDPQVCVECRKMGLFNQSPTEGLPLVKIRGPEALTPLQVEQLALLTEEAGEVSQRVGKILRWGLDANFEGTSSIHKLEVELGDELAMMIIGHHNGLVNLDNIVAHAREKLEKLRVDARGPRQRLRHAKVPAKECVFLDVFVREERS